MSLLLTPDSIVFTEKGAQYLDLIEVGDKLLNSNNEFFSVIAINDSVFSKQLVQLQGHNVLPTVVEESIKDHVLFFDIKLPISTDFSFDKLNPSLSKLFCHLLLSKYKVNKDTITLIKSKFKNNTQLEDLLTSLGFIFKKEDKAFSVEYKFKSALFIQILSTTSFKDLPNIVEDYSQFYFDYVSIFNDTNITPTLINTTDIYVLYKHLQQNEITQEINNLTDKVLFNTPFDTFETPFIEYDYNSVSEQGQRIEGKTVTLESGQITFNLLFYNAPQ